VFWERAIYHGFRRDGKARSAAQETGVRAAAYQLQRRLPNGKPEGRPSTRASRANTPYTLHVDTILLVQRDLELRRLWKAALRGLGVRVIATDSLLSVPRLVQREKIALVIAEVIGGEEFAELRWTTAAIALPPLVIVTDAEHLPPLAARSRGAAVIPRGRPLTLRNTVEELLAARHLPAMNLPLRLPQVCETKWTARLQLAGYDADLQDTWPGNRAA
jgi:hypothetical protein